MTSTTTNYNLTMYDPVTDASELFLDYRTDMAGTSGSNVTKLEAALTAIQDSIDALELSKGAEFVNATFDSGSLYVATGISGITSYATNLKIILQIDQDSDGTVTLNINSLGVKSVYTINNAGTAINLTSNHFKKNRRYDLIYNGTSWIIVSDVENPAILIKNIEILSATKTLTDYSGSVQALDPDGSHRDVELPAEADTNPYFYIANTAGGAENLVVKSDAPATIATLGQNERGLFFSDGVAWYGHVFKEIAPLYNMVEDVTPQLGGNLDANGKNIEGVTPDEMSYLSGVSSDIQTQLNAKGDMDDLVDDTSPTLGGNLDLDGKQIDSVTATEIGHLSGVSSAIQTQLNAKGTLDNVVEDTSPQLGGDLNLNGNNLTDSNDNEILEATQVASAVNHISIANAIATNAPKVEAKGTDTNIDLELAGKGTGVLSAQSNIDGNANTLYGFEGEINTQTGTTYTLLSSDNGKIVTLNNASAITLTVGSTLPAGFNCLIIQKGAGQVTVAAGGTGNVRNFDTHTKLAGQYAIGTLFIESNAGTAPEVYFAGNTTS